MGRSLGGRVIAVVGGILIVGLALRLLGNILKPVLPGALMQALSDGWNLLYGMVSPAVAAIAAAAILVALCWVVLAWLRRY
jgi:hypothetical protein